MKLIRVAYTMFQIEGELVMKGKKIWEKSVECDDWSDARINVHITQSDKRKIDRIERNVFYVNPNRIGIDFDNFNDETHAFIPNLSVSDIVQLVNRLHLLQKDFIREALINKVIPHGFGVELDSRRKVDFDIGRCETSGEEEIIIEYEDPLRSIERFEIGRIDVEYLPRLIRSLKEAYIEYYHIMQKSLILKELL